MVKPEDFSTQSIFEKAVKKLIRHADLRLHSTNKASNLSVVNIDNRSRFLCGLLNRRITSRLGCTDIGFQAIEKLDFFHGLDWSLVPQKLLVPVFKPSVFFNLLQQKIINVNPQILISEQEEIDELRIKKRFRKSNIMQRIRKTDDLETLVSKRIMFGLLKKQRSTIKKQVKELVFLKEWDSISSTFLDFSCTEPSLPKMNFDNIIQGKKLTRQCSPQCQEALLGLSKPQVYHVLVQSDLEEVLEPNHEPLTIILPITGDQKTSSNDSLSNSPTPNKDVTLPVILLQEKNKSFGSISKDTFLRTARLEFHKKITADSVDSRSQQIQPSAKYNLVGEIQVEFVYQGKEAFKNIGWLQDSINSNIQVENHPSIHQLRKIASEVPAHKKTIEIVEAPADSIMRSKCNRLESIPFTPRLSFISRVFHKHSKSSLNSVEQVLSSDSSPLSMNPKTLTPKYAVFDIMQVEEEEELQCEKTLQSVMGQSDISDSINQNRNLVVLKPDGGSAVEDLTAGSNGALDITVGIRNIIY